MEERAESDGIRIMTSNGARNRTPGKAVGNVFDKGRTLFMCALYVFVIALVECIVNLCIRNVIHSNVAYVIIPFCCAFVMFGIFLFLYLRGFGKNSRKSQSLISLRKFDPVCRSGRHYLFDRLDPYCELCYGRYLYSNFKIWDSPLHLYLQHSSVRYFL